MQKVKVKKPDAVYMAAVNFYACKNCGEIMIFSEEEAIIRLEKWKKQKSKK